jgi:hypothetical protein
MDKLKNLILISCLSLDFILHFGVSSVSAQNIAGNETGNMTTGIITTNGTTVNMTNASAPMITNTI